MIRSTLYQIAGIDRETIATCPPTDRVWAAHLGFSLLLSFVVVFGISFHATGYVIQDIPLRFLAATVVALTVFMFDRALYQSDWFYQGVFAQNNGDAGDGRASSWRSMRRFLRVTIRLAISFAMAWIIALFLELAVFSDTIGDKIKRDHVTANQAIFQKIERYEAQLSDEIAERASNLASLEALYRTEMAAKPPADPAASARFDEYEQQIRALDAPEQQLRSELRQIEAQLMRYAEDMNAEQLGRKLNPSNSGVAGAGRRYQFAKQQREVYEAQRADREKELLQLRVKRDELRALQASLATDAAARRNQELATAFDRRSQLEAARVEWKNLEASRLGKIHEFRRNALAASEFQKQKDDPLSRMTAYQELKNDPKDGPTIVLFSWMTKLFVIFLEIVPVVAKMFFSPPSVYAAKIQAEVDRERKRVMRQNGDLSEDGPRGIIPEGEHVKKRRQLLDALQKVSMET